jgi:hypothetical protein
MFNKKLIPLLRIQNVGRLLHVHKKEQQIIDNNKTCDHLCTNALSGRKDVTCTLKKNHTGMHENQGEHWNDDSSFVIYGC